MIASAPVNDMVLGLADFLNDQLGTYLAGVEGHVGDGLQLPPPAEISVGYRDGANAKKYPFMCVVLTDGAAPPSAMGAQQVEATVDIGLAVVDSKPEVLEKLLLRYVDALCNCLGANEGIAGVCDVSEIRAFDVGHGALGDKSLGTVVLSLYMQKEVLTQEFGT